MVGTQDVGLWGLGFGLKALGSVSVQILHIHIQVFRFSSIDSLFGVYNPPG